MTAEDDRMLVVVAHPDDETYGCGSLLAHAADLGVAVTVVCATRGEAGEPAPGSGVAVEDLAPVREAELRAAAAHLGVDEVVVLGWRDSGIDGEPPSGSLWAAPLDEVAAGVENLIERVRPTVVVTMDASDGHRDHVHIRDATLAAVERASWPVPRTFLSCLPRRIMRAWIDVLRAQDPDSDYLHLDALGTPEEDIHVVIDTSHLLERREEAIALHRSQVPPHDMLPADLRREVLSAECLRQMRPPWPGGPVAAELFSPRAARGDRTPG